MISDHAAAQADPEAVIAEIATFEIREDAYGYSIRPGEVLRRRATMVEWAAYFLAFMSLFATFGLLAILESPTGGSFDLFQAGLALAGAVFSGFFFWIAVRGTALELQVDTGARQIRTAVRNWRGRARILESFAFGEITEIFVTGAGLQTQLCVATTNIPQGVELVGGDARSLAAVLSIVSDDVSQGHADTAAQTDQPVRRKPGIAGLNAAAAAG